jgi:hypothetical protein
MEGVTMIEAADREMAAKGVSKPARMAAVFVPGFIE